MVNQNSRLTPLLRLFIFSMTFLVSGCATGFSHFERSVTVSETYENYDVLPDHQYYYNGLPYSPDAVVAVKKGYTLNSPYWHASDVDKQKLSQWIQEMRNIPGSEYNLDPNGAYILNEKGEQIGQWYSVWDFPVLKFISATEFYLPNLMTLWPPGHADPEDRMFPSIFR